MNDERATLAIVIVSYNVRELLRRCLQSIARSAAASQLKVRIVVVDSASHDGSVEMLRSEFPAVELVASPENIGFARGNNVALGMLLGLNVGKLEGWKVGWHVPQPSNLPTLQPSNPEYILLLNPDTEIKDDAPAQMVEYLERHPEVAVVGPRLRYGDGTLQSSRRRFPTPASLFWESTLLEQWWPRNPWARRYRYDDRAVEQAAPADWLVGAALMLRSESIRQAGMFDERFWMYSEELEWQSRLAYYGGIVYLPWAEIVHHEGKSSEQNMSRRHIAFNRSKLLYARLRWGRRVELPLRLFLLLAYIVQIVLEAAKWLLGHKRPLRRSRIGQHARVLGALVWGDVVA